MKRVLISIITITLLVASLYIQSSDTSQIKSEKPAEPVATLATTKQLLMKLRDQLQLFQRKNAAQSERLSGVFAKWKQAGKIKQAEQWNKVRNGIDALLSYIQMVLNNFDYMQKLRRNKELFTALNTLEKESQKFSPQMGDTRFLMQSASLYGKRIFEDKLLDKLKELTTVAPQKEKEEKINQIDQYDSFDFDSDSDFDLNTFDNSYDDSFYSEDLSFDDFDGGFDFDDDDFYF